MQDNQQDNQGVSPSGPGCQPSASAADAASQSGIPDAGWRSLDSIPRDGTVFVVRYHPWNNKNIPPAIQCAQCLPFQPELHAPWDTDNLLHADAWMPLDELNAQAIEARSDETRSGSAEGESAVGSADAPGGQ